VPSRYANEMMSRKKLFPLLYQKNYPNAVPVTPSDKKIELRIFSTILACRQEIAEYLRYVRTVNFNGLFKMTD